MNRQREFAGLKMNSVPTALDIQGICIPRVVVATSVMILFMVWLISWSDSVMLLMKDSVKRLLSAYELSTTEPGRAEKMIACFAGFNLGLLHTENKEYDQAESYFTQSLQIAIDNRFLKEESIALGNLGYTKILRKDFPAAMSLLDNKLKLAEMMNDKLELIKVLGNIGNTHCELKNFSAALECYRRILEYRLYLGDEKGAELTRQLISDTIKKMNSGK